MLWAGGGENQKQLLSHTVEMMAVDPKKAYFEWKTQEFRRKWLDKDKLSSIPVLEWMARSLQPQKFFFSLFIYISLIRQIKLSYPILSVAHYFKEALLIVFQFSNSCFNHVLHVLSYFSGKH